MTPPFDVADELRRHGHALRALAMALVRDAAVADDVVQDVWVQALQRPPRHHGALGGWLATALHNVVRGWRRRERRRARHEQAFAAGVVTVGPAADAAAAREQRAHELLRALAALEPVYRDAVWQRFFEGKPPRAIAAAGGVPVATVKSRLQRSLGMLRERLGEGDRERGGDWRAGLAAAFGLREGTAAGTAGVVAVTTTGGVLVATWTKVVVGVAGIALAAMVWWPRATPIIPATETELATRAPAAAAVAVPDTDVAPVSRVDDENARVAVATGHGGAALAIVRGRCVDPAGLPLADCAVRLSGNAQQSGRDDDWLLEHGDTPVDHLATTAMDGAFELAIEPPPPFHFHVRATADARAPATRALRTLAPGARVDLGDLVLPPGVLLRGRVLDGGHQPVADRPIGFASVNRETSLFARTDDRGAFALPYPLPAGVYRPHAGSECTLVAPAQVELHGSERVLDLVIEVTRAPQVAIHGLVVGEDDRPVADARVTWRDDDGRSGDATRSRDDGAFRLYAPAPGASPDVRLEVHTAGLEPTDPDVRVPWGARDVRLRVRRLGALTVSVADHAGRAVSGCSVRVLHADTERWQGEAPAASGRTGDDGVVTLAGIGRGPWIVVARCPPSRALQPMLAPVQIDGEPRRVELHADAFVERIVRVVRSDGSAVAGTRVELCELLGNTFANARQVLEPGAWFLGTRGTRIVVLEHWTTGVDGTVRVRGPAGRPMGLRVLGAGHVRHQADDVRLDVQGEFVVTVRDGARVRGRVVPAESVAELRRLARGIREAPATAHSRPRIGLRRGEAEFEPDPRTIPTPADLARFQLRDDGTFDVAGLPEGRWRVELWYWQHHVGAAGTSGSHSRRIDLGEHVLRDGAPVELRVDASDLLPGTLRATVLQNGEPWSGANLMLAWDGAGSGAWEERESTPVTTDEAGQLQFIGRPGRYRLRRADDATAFATPAVDVVRGGMSETTFAFTLGQLEVRLLRPDGRPADRVWLHGASRIACRTDAGGVAHIVASPAAVTLRVLPERLQADARAQFATPGAPGDPFAEHWLDLGSAAITVDGALLELRLPPDWEK